MATIHNAKIFWAQTEERKRSRRKKSPKDAKDICPARRAVIVVIRVTQAAPIRAAALTQVHHRVSTCHYVFRILFPALRVWRKRILALATRNATHGNVTIV